MKKLFVAVGCMVVFVSLSHAGIAQIFSKPTKNLGTYSVATTSTTGAVVRPENLARKGIEIYNNGSLTVEISSSATQAYGTGHPILSGASFVDNIEAYRGAWYARQAAAAASQNLRVIEKW